MTETVTDPDPDNTPKDKLIFFLEGFRCHLLGLRLDPYNPTKTPDPQPWLEGRMHLFLWSTLSDCLHVYVNVINRVEASRNLVSVSVTLH